MRGQRIGSARTAQLLPAAPWVDQGHWRNSAGEHALITRHKQIRVGENGTGQHLLIVSIDQTQRKGLGRTWGYWLLAQKRLDSVDLL